MHPVCCSLTFAFCILTADFCSLPPRCWAEINLAALRHNVGVVRAAVGPDTTILAIVKADGYGHGMVPVARVLHATGEVTHFGVANVVEGIHLRDGLPEARVTILSPALPGERPEIVRRGFLPWISTLAEAEDYARLAREQATAPPFPVEIKLDTGMGRMGVLEQDFDALHAAVLRLPSLRLAGILTHLPSADEDAAFTAAQLDRLARLQGRLPSGESAPTGENAGVSAQELPTSAFRLPRSNFLPRPE